MGNIKALLTLINSKRPAYDEAELYSDGRKSEVWASASIARKLAKSAGRYPVNIARGVIEAVLDRLEITEVSVADDDNSGTATEALQEIYDANQLDLDLPDAMDKVTTYGDCYIVQWPSPDDEDMVDVFVNDPKNMAVIYDPENPRSKLFAGRTWLDSDGFRRVTLWFDGPRVERYRSKVKQDDAGVMYLEDNEYEPYLTDPDNPDSWSEDLALGLGLPVFHLRNAKPYGRPAHRAAYGTQNMLTKQIAIMMDASDSYGFPFRYQLTKSGTTGTQATLDDGDWGDDDDPTSRHAPQAAGTKANPGELAKLVDTDSVGQLEAAQVGNFIEPIGLTLRLSSVVTKTPLSYFDPSAAAASGESKKEHEKPAVKKAERVKAWLDAGIKDALAYSLALRDPNMFSERVGEDIYRPNARVMITWAPVASVDEAAEVSLSKDRQDAGVPALVALTQLGYPEEEVKRWIEEATPDDKLLEHRVTLLQTFADAAAKLGTAATLGVIDATTVQQLVTMFVADTGPKPQIPETDPGDE